MSSQLLNTFSKRLILHFSTLEMTHRTLEGLMIAEHGDTVVLSYYSIGVNYCYILYFHDAMAGVFNLIDATNMSILV